MAYDISITVKDDLNSIETQLSRFEQKRAVQTGPFRARVSSDRRHSYFKDIWAAIAVAAGIDGGTGAEITAWGVQDWSKRSDEDSFALSYPSLLALQRGARVLSDSKPPEELDGASVKRGISLSGGVLGTGARQFTLVELDPDFPVAAPLTIGLRRDAFFEFIRNKLKLLEIGALSRNSRYPTFQENSAKGTVVEFLYELHANAFEHGRSDFNTRLLRLQKHLYMNRDGAMRHAREFNELKNYITSQPERPSANMFNLVEASISDFGPGILDGFLSTFAGTGHKRRPRKELLDDLLHQQLSSKSSDPSAGLGIAQALTAARDMDAFVSLRTGEFWLTMRGRLDGNPRLTFRDGEFPHVIGTHWQLLLPDPNEVNFSGGKRA